MGEASLSREMRIKSDHCAATDNAGVLIGSITCTGAEELIRRDCGLMSGRIRLGAQQRAAALAPQWAGSRKKTGRSAGRRTRLGWPLLMHKGCHSQLDSFFPLARSVSARRLHDHACHAALTLRPRTHTLSPHEPPASRSASQPPVGETRPGIRVLRASWPGHAFVPTLSTSLTALHPTHPPLRSKPA